MWVYVQFNGGGGRLEWVSLRSWSTMWKELILLGDRPEVLHICVGVLVIQFIDFSSFGGAHKCIVRHQTDDAAPRTSEELVWL